MAFLSQSNESMNDERIKFVQSFENKVQDEVEKFELAEFRANASVYQDLNLHTYRPSLWGLVIFCKKEIYYYVAPQDTYLSFMSKGIGRTEEMMFCMSKLQNIKVSLPEKKFFDFLSPESNRTVYANYTSKDGSEKMFTFIFNKKIPCIFEELSAKLNGTK